MLQFFNVKRKKKQRTGAAPVATRSAGVPQGKILWDPKIEALHPVVEATIEYLEQEDGTETL